MISIIIPTYNRAEFLPRAINSVLDQTFQDWELIISDDGSTDHTEEVVERFLKDPRIRYVVNPNRGATFARNSGAKNASRNFLTFLDSDDEAHSSWLQSFADEIEKGAEVVCCGYRYYDHKGEPIGENFPFDLGEIYENRVGRFTNGGVFILKKELFQEIGGYDENVQSGQHSELALRLIPLLSARDIDIVNIFKPLIKVHVHKGEKIRKNNLALYKGTLYTLEKHQKLFENHPAIYRNYLGIAALGAFRLNKIKKSQTLFYKAWKVNPLSVKAFGRVLLSRFPSIGMMVWGENEKKEH